MTETEWLTAADWHRMLDHRVSRASDRKFRLFAVAWFRRYWDVLRKPYRNLIELADRSADEDVPLNQLLGAVAFARNHARRARQKLGKAYPLLARTQLVNLQTAIPDIAGLDGGYEILRAAGVSYAPADSREEYEGLLRRDDRARCGLVREVIGNPFRPVTLPRHWLTPAVVGVARGIYAEGRFEEMPILGDALEEAGCDNEDILSHCRGPGGHVRGCWLIDLILGKR